MKFWSREPTAASEEEKDAALRELRSRLDATLGAVDPQEDARRPSSGRRDDDSLLRFLRARKFNVDKAEELFVNMIKWRGEVGADTILDTPDPKEHLYEEHCPRSNDLYDREGHPVYLEFTGSIDVPKLHSLFEDEELVQRHVRQMEINLRRADQMSERLGRNIEKLVVVMDLKGLSLNPVRNRKALNIFKQTLKIDQLYYPERLHRLYLINAPTMFNMLWRVIKPWLDPETRAKFQICGSSYGSALRELLDDDNILPIHGGSFAGTCVAPYGEGTAKSGADNTAAEFVEEPDTADAAADCGASGDSDGDAGSEQR